MRRLVLVSALTLGGASSIQADGIEAGSSAAPYSRITVDLEARAFDRVLPFDVPFTVTGKVPDGTVRVTVQFTQVPESGLPAAPVWTPAVPAVWQAQSPATSGADTFLLLVRDTLDARRVYRFRFTVVGRQAAESSEIVVDGETTRGNYVSADAGLLYGPDIEAGALYVGSNIYFRPVNKRAPLSDKGSFLRRTAVTIGFTVTSMADEDNRRRSDLFGHQSLVLGAGVRLTQSIRAGAGALVFKEHSPNPLITTTSAATTPYVSFSFDLDVAAMFQQLGW